MAKTYKLLGEKYANEIAVKLNENTGEEGAEDLLAGIEHTLDVTNPAGKQYYATVYLDHVNGAPAHEGWRITYPIPLPVDKAQYATPVAFLDTKHNPQEEATYRFYITDKNAAIVYYKFVIGNDNRVREEFYKILDELKRSVGINFNLEETKENEEEDLLRGVDYLSTEIVSSLEQYPDPNMRMITRSAIAYTGPVERRFLDWIKNNILKIFEAWGYFDMSKRSKEELQADFDETEWRVNLDSPDDVFEYFVDQAAENASYADLEIEPEEAGEVVDYEFQRKNFLRGFHRLFQQKDGQPLNESEDDDLLAGVSIAQSQTTHEGKVIYGVVTEDETGWYATPGKPSWVDTDGLPSHAVFVADGIFKEPDKEGAPWTTFYITNREHFNVLEKISKKVDQYSKMRKNPPADLFQIYKDYYTFFVRNGNTPDAEIEL
ncbi:MAG: hypothetical protein EBR30_01170 [Cytophagia bacterium]|jgi:hypothetical protein|nr:hypothetical protein [Cytophagia bacterium]